VTWTKAYEPCDEDADGASYQGTDKSAQDEAAGIESSVMGGFVDFVVHGVPCKGARGLRLPAVRGCGRNRRPVETAQDEAKDELGAEKTEKSLTLKALANEWWGKPYSL
jgi:hypothetical protein